MMDRKNSPLFIGGIALLFVLLAVAIGWRVVNGDNSLLREVHFQYDLITPNADGDKDALLIEYTLSRNATVSIAFSDETGQTYYFRQDKIRGAGDYRVLFSGVVDGYVRPGEHIAGEVLSRLLADGTYQWTITAVDLNGTSETAQGTLTIQNADTALPEMRNFTVDTTLFTPNRDGLNDRVHPQFFLTKEAATLRVFLVTADGAELPISELERDVPARMPGYHIYDYEGGVDNGETPPPDGTYPIVALAEDAEGQRVRVEQSLTIQYGGVPRADIFAPPSGDTLEFNTTAVPLCQTISFTVTVQNYGNTPIRTSGPLPGTTYDSDWNYNTLGWFTQSGVWRVGIGFENELTTYPYRWAIGRPQDLERIDGYDYLMPGKRAVVNGSIRVVGPFGDRNPQPIWAGLIHEDVEIAQFNTHVDPHAIQVDMPDAAHITPCEPREIPKREEANP